jgi:hypothetical protein
MTYPIEDINSQIAVDGLNTLLSGPSGLGQDFNGFSSYTPAWLTGNYRVPYTDATVANLYVAPINLGVSELLDPYTWKFNFASTQASVPFVNGMGIYVSGVSNPIYDGFYEFIGVVKCTTDYVIARTSNPYSAAPATGGYVLYSSTSIDPNNATPLKSTDCNSKITVTGGTDRVFIAAQLNNKITYDFGLPSDLTYKVQINRYIGSPNSDPTNPGYRFGFDKTVSQRIYTYTGLTSGDINQESIFSTLIDSDIPPGYYWYILEVQFDSDDGGYLQVTESEFGLRSMTTQVVKQ